MSFNAGGQDNSSKRQRLNDWKLGDDNNASLSLDNLLQQRPIDWETVLGRIAQEQASTDAKNCRSPNDMKSVVSDSFFVRALHLACDGVNAETRIDDMALFMQLLSSVSQEARVKGITSYEPGTTLPGERAKTPLHKACARNPSDNSFWCVGRSNEDLLDSGSAMDQALALPTINLLLNCLKLDTNGLCPGICVQDDEGKTCLHYAVEWVVVNENNSNLSDTAQPQQSGTEDQLPHARSEWLDNDEESMPNEWLVDDEEDEEPASVGDEKKEVQLSCSESALADLIDLFKQQSSLLLQDDQGNTPLMTALMSRLENVDNSVEYVLIEACPEAILKHNTRGYTPVHGLVEYMTSWTGEEGRSMEHNEELFRHFTSLSLFREVMSLQTHEEGYTPLHFACASGNDVDEPARYNYGIFEALLNSDKSVHGSFEDFFCVSDHEGYTPLHLAVVRGAPNGIIAFLILMNPKACLCSDSYWYTPLYKAFHLHMNAIATLLRELNDQAKDCDLSRMMSPIDRALALREKLSKEQRQLVSLLAMLTQGQCCNTDAEPKVDITLTSITIANDDCRAFSLDNLVHCGASVACPTDVFHLFLKLYQDQLERYIDGETPIHRWCRNQVVPPFRQTPAPIEIPEEGDPEGDSSAFTTDLEPEDHITEEQRCVRAASSSTLKRRGNRREILELILRYAPETALSEDNCGKTPVNLAIEHGQIWEGEIELLLKASPKILYSQDPDSNLFPFMLAASIGDTVKNVEDRLLESEETYARQKDCFRELEDVVLSGSQGLRYIEYEHARKTLKGMKSRLDTQRKNADMERRRLDTIFHLLVAQPSLIGTGIPKEKGLDDQDTRIIRCTHCNHCMLVQL